MKKGFTLIELLVVIAIIGILTSVILASIQSARQKDKNQTEAERCELLSQTRSIENLPAKCLKYVQ